MPMQSMPMQPMHMQAMHMQSMHMQSMAQAPDPATHVCRLALLSLHQHLGGHVCHGALEHAAHVGLGALLCVYMVWKVSS